MQSEPDRATIGRVNSLHAHPATAGAPMESRAFLQLIAGHGIEGNSRYFGRKSRTTGHPSVRQVSLMEREQIAAHADSLGLPLISPGLVRANIETEGINLVELVGRAIEVGEAVLLIREPRAPCAKMDNVHPGLRALMHPNRQGVLAQVIRSGRVQAGDSIYPSQISVESVDPARHIP